jgi:23S rRNA-/tRNA-specific pseudouridylate synthase
MDLPANSEEKRETTAQMLSVSEYLKRGVEIIDIHLDCIEEKYRIDKLLVEYIEDFSRTEIKELIKAGFIRVNDNTVKPNLSLKQGQKISLMIRNFQSSGRIPEQKS